MLEAITQCYCRLIVAALDNLLSFDVTDNIFDKIQSADSSPSAIDANARPSCLGDKQKPAVREKTSFLASLLLLMVFCCFSWYCHTFNFVPWV